MRITQDQRLIKDYMLETHMKGLIDRTLDLDWNALAEFRSLVPEVSRDMHDRLAKYLDEQTWKRMHG